MAYQLPNLSLICEFSTSDKFLLVTNLWDFLVYKWRTDCQFLIVVRASPRVLHILFPSMFFRKKKKKNHLQEFFIYLPIFPHLANRHHLRAIYTYGLGARIRRIRRWKKKKKERQSSKWEMHERKIWWKGLNIYRNKFIFLMTGLWGKSREKRIKIYKTLADDFFFFLY